MTNHSSISWHLVLVDQSQLRILLSLIDQSQVIFVWTDEQNDKETVKHLKQLGVNGVIYDRMDQNNDKPVKESIFFSCKVNDQSKTTDQSQLGI